MSGGDVEDWPDRLKYQLLEAAYEGSSEKIHRLLLQDVPVDATDDDAVTALQIAAFLGNKDLVHFLLSCGANMELASEMGMTPFLHACREGKIEVVDLLLQKGADYRRMTYLGASAFTLAVAGGHMEVVQRLMTAFNGNPIGSSGICPTPLITAAFRNSPQLCGFLVIRCGFPVDEKMESLMSLSALSCTIMCSTTVIFKALLCLGADTQKRSLRHMTASELAKRIGRTEIESILKDTLQRYDITDIRSLIHQEKIKGQELGAHKDDLFSDGSTPLLFSVADSVRSAVSELIDLNVNLNTAESKYDLTALQIAALLRQDDVVSLLLSSGGEHRRVSLFRMTAFDFYIANSDEHDPSIRKQLHPHRPQRVENQFNLSSSSNSFTKTSVQGIFSRVTSQFTTEKTSEPPITAEQWRDLRIQMLPIEGRNHKKLVLTDQILRKTRNICKKGKISMDSPIEVVRCMAAECQSFVVNCFYDYYTKNGEEFKMSPAACKSDYDSALHFSSLYGYSKQHGSTRNFANVNVQRRDFDASTGRKPRVLSSLEATVYIRPGYQSSSSSMQSDLMYSSSFAQPSQQRAVLRTPRTLKKRDSMVPEEVKSGYHDNLRKTNSTPQLVIPTVLSSPHQPRLSRSIQIQERRSFTSRDWLKELQGHVSEGVIRILDREEVDARQFLSMSEDDFLKMGIRQPEALQDIRSAQQVFSQGVV